MKLDTGAAANLLHKDYGKLKDKPKIHKAGVRLSNYNGHDIHVVGSCVVTVRAKNGSHPVRFVIVNNGPSILGAESCERLGLVKRCIVFGKIKKRS